MKLKFKQFNEYVDLRDEELTEEKLDEIFGTFFNKVADAVTKTSQQKREEEIKKKLAAKRNDLKSKEDELKKQKAFAAAKASVEMDKLARKTRSEANPRSASGARAAEREWVASMAAEGVLSIEDLMQLFEYEKFTDADGVTWNDEGDSDRGHTNWGRGPQKTSRAPKSHAHSSKRFYHVVPFKNKDDAKAEGMKWDAEKKKWYHTDESLSAESEFAKA